MVTRRLLTAAGVVTALALGAPALVAAQTTTRVSVGSGGGENNGHNYWGAVSTTGRYVAFSSDATNVVPGDTNAKTDVFWRDTVTGEVQRVSVNDDGVQGNGRSFASAVSKDGRLVLFWSHATNLVPNDTNGQPDVFMHDRGSHTTTRLSIGVDGAQPNGWCSSPTMSEDGRWVAFESWANNLVLRDTNDFQDIFLLDRRSGVLTRVGQPVAAEANEDSRQPQLSPNGRYLAFESTAWNLVPGDVNGADDAFVWDRVRGTLVLASVADNEVQGDRDSSSPVVGDSGRYVTFSSLSTNLVLNDTNLVSDAFVRDLRRGTTRRVSVDSNGVQGNGHSNRGTLDSTGRYIVFTSLATNLAPNDGNGVFDAFVHDLSRGTTVKVSVAHDGGEINGNIFGVSFANNRTLFVSSNASNLVAGDGNAAEDLFFIRWR